MHQGHQNNILHQAQGHNGGPKIFLWFHCSVLWNIEVISIPNTPHSGWKSNQLPRQR